MNDRTELKALALAATPGNWELREVDGVGAIAHPHGWVLEGTDSEDLADKRFIAAASPTAVLQLLDELSGYQQGATAEARAADEARAEVRRLTADNRALIKAVRFSAETFGKITSSDGSGHADIGVAVLRIAGLSQPDHIQAATGSQEDTVSGVVRDHAEFELEVLEAGVTAYHGYLRSCSMRESGFMLNAMQAARTAMWDHSMSRPFLFALAEDRTACTLDIGGQAHHYVEDSRVEGLLLDAGRYRAFRAAGLPNGLGVYDEDLDRECDKLAEDQAYNANAGKETSHANEA